MRDICVIFDLDGTLVDSEVICIQVLADLLPDCSDPVEHLLQRYRGEKLSSIFQDIEDRLSRTLPLNFEALYRATLSKRFAQGLQPIHGVLPMMEHLKHPRCIASGGPPDKIIQTLELSGLAHTLAPISTVRMTSEALSPIPACFCMPRARWDLNPTNAWWSRTASWASKRQKLQEW